MSRLLVILLLAMASCSATRADVDGGWKLEKQKDGISVYSRERDDSDYREFRAEAFVAAQLNQLMGVLDDTAACPRWMHNCLAPVLLAEPDVLERFTYMRNDLPWPYKDRALLVRSSITPGDTEVRIALQGIEREALPAAARDKLPDLGSYPWAERFAGEFTFVPVEGGHQVSYRLHIDLGGSPSATLANGVIAETPLKTLAGLRAIVEEQRYRDFEIPAWESVPATAAPNR
ncbi:hypothetical protein FHR99_001455 [Litorivivens lipolytica]|uniref:START domain-containing protein n=1 Tax=Litorivivens lipolytica TaxID=1524264 RepID=A0A7W4W5E8_9GAMM|nr:hypothetical protein [Litorivivens lipolytica]MBB3047219.1 hypothetical protein [Litorivivens lipolytica]